MSAADPVSVWGRVFDRAAYAPGADMQLLNTIACLRCSATTAALQRQYGMADMRDYHAQALDELQELRDRINTLAGR